MREARKPKQHRRLTIEALEKRELMAADTSVTFANTEASVLLGETSRLTIEFSSATQSGEQIGYGPHLDLAAIDLLTTAQAADQTYADSARLYSHASSPQGSSNTGEFSIGPLMSLQYSRPELKIHKGVVSSNNPNANFVGMKGPHSVSFFAPGNDASFIGKFSHDSYLKGPVDADIENVEAGEIIRVAVVTENVSQGAGGAQEVRLRDALPKGFEIPTSGLNLQIRDGEGNPLEYFAIASNEALAFFNSGIQLLEPLPSLGSETGSNFVVITYDIQVSNSVELGARSSANAEILHYAAIPNGNNYATPELMDNAQLSIALPTVSHELVGTSQDYTKAADVAIGENATFQVQIQLPEAKANQAELRIDLPRGMAIHELTSIEWTQGIELTKSAEEILSGARIEDHGNQERNHGRILILDLGDIDNVNRDSLNQDTLTMQYDATITNDLENNDGDKRRSKATFSYATGEAVSKSESVKITEADLTLTRNFSTNQIDAADIVQARIEISHQGSDTDAYELEFLEALPAGWKLLPESVAATGIELQNVDVHSGRISASLTHLPFGESASIAYSFTVVDHVHAGAELSAQSELTWTSLPGSSSQIKKHTPLGHERTGDVESPGGEANNYKTQSTGTLQVLAPQIQTSLLATSSDATTGNRLTIGETASFEVQVRVPEGVHELQLGFHNSIESTELEFTELVLNYVGSNIRLERLLTGYGSEQLEIKEDGTVELGQVHNHPDNLEDDNDVLKFTFTLELPNDESNVHDALAEITANLNYQFGQVADEQTIKIAEPGVLTSANHEHKVDAGQIAEVHLKLSHNSKYGSSPQNITFTGYSGSDRLEFVPGSVELSTGEILAGNGETDRAARIYIPQLEPGQSADLLMQVRIAKSVQPAEVLELLGITEWESLSEGVGRGYASSQNIQFEVNSSSISGWAFVDENQDGIRSNEDKALTGSLISLVGVDHLGESVRRQTRASGNGFYLFSELRPGNYSLHHEQLATFDDGRDYVGSLGGKAVRDRITNIIIPTGASSQGTGYNFTETSLTWISGTVFVDHSQDGELGSDETGIANVVVSLTGVSDSGEEISRELKTNRRGYFVFGSLPAGTFSLSQAQPEGYFDAHEQLGTAGGETGSDAFHGIAIGAGRPGEFYNFGEYKPSTLEGQLYIDYDRDLVRDRLDGLLAGLEVMLTGVNDLGEEVTAVTESSLDGTYRFENLRPGEYAISSIAVKGLDKGVSNVGIFRGGANAASANGIAAEYGFESIFLPEGTVGTAYDIGHIDPNHAESLLVDDFESHYVLAGTDESDRFDVQLTTQEASIKINEDLYTFDSSERIAFSVIGFFGDDKVIVTGSTHKEEMDIRSDSARLKGTWFSGLFYGMESITFEGGGNEDLVRFYDNSGDSHLEASPFTAKWASDGYAHQVSDIHRIYAYASNGGYDTANLSGSDRRDNFIATPDNARLYDGDYYIWVEGFDNVSAKATDLRDKAYLYGKVDKNDHLIASEYHTNLTGDSYQLNADSFRYVTINGGAGNKDTAQLIGTHDDDSLVSRPSVATFDADDTRIVAKGFESVDVDAVKGNDSATLHDSHFDDLFQANSEVAAMSNSVSTITAVGFDDVTAYAAAGGEDRAVVEGGSGKDIFRGWAEKWKLEGSEFGLRGYGFTQVVASSTDSADRAYLYDSAGNDVFEVRDDFAQLSGARFNNQVSGYGRVVAEAENGGLDRVISRDTEARSTVRYDGEKLTVFGNGFSNNALGFEVVDAIYSELTDDDRVELAEDVILEMILEDDDELRYRLNLSAGPAGSAESLRDRVSNLPVSQ